nr:hypothetical protein [Tanacetum cinerariifolium]GFA15636.1 hypothetical protein [Tanacetum cinerariifolium]
MGGNGPERVRQTVELGQKVLMGHCNFVMVMTNGKMGGKICLMESRERSSYKDKEDFPASTITNNHRHSFPIRCKLQMHALELSHHATALSMRLCHLNCC